MKFENKYEFQEWLGELLYSKIGGEVHDISGESEETTGRCDLLITFKNDDEIKLSISMEKGEVAEEVDNIKGLTNEDIMAFAKSLREGDA